MTLAEFNKAKIGNLIVLLSEKIKLIDRAKLMKLIYFIDEAAVKECGVPVTWFDYQLCKKGPAPKEMWRDKLSGSNFFSEYVDIRKNENNVSVVIPKVECQHVEFSKYERRIINDVVAKYGEKTFEELSSITHKGGTPWTLSKEKYGVKDGEDSECIVDLSFAVPDDLRPIYEEASDLMRYKAEMAA